MAIIYGLKVNLSVAMVAMVNQTAVKGMSHSNNTGHGSIASNITREECEADPPKAGATAGDQVNI